MRKHKYLLLVLISLVLIQLCHSTAATGANADDSTMFHHDLNHSGYASGNIYSNSSKLLWNFTTGLPVFSSPAVVSGYVYIGSSDGFIYCLNASNGQNIWKSQTGGEVRSSPAIANGRLVVGCDDGWVYCLNITTGKPFWISKVGGYVRSCPAVVGDCVYIGSGGHNLSCFNFSDGTAIWNFTTSTLSRVDSSPAVLDGVVYVAADDFFTYAINASTGNQIWHTHTGSTKSSPCLYNGFVCVGSYDGYVCALNSSTGYKVWQYQTEDEVASSPAVAYGRIYIGSFDNNLYCLNASNGQKLWQSSTGYWILSSPVVADGNVYVGSEDSSIYCFDAFTGAKRWSYETGNYVDSSPTIVNNTLYVGSCDHSVYAFALCNSTAQPSPPKLSNSLKWSTIAFDTVAAAIGFAIIFLIAFFAYSRLRASRNFEATNTFGSKQPWYLMHTDALCVLAILAFSTIFLVNLGIGQLWAADEQTYSQWAFHMIKAGDYLTPWCFGGLGIWIAKPPLLMWLMAISYQAIGVTNFAARIWTPMFGALSLVLVFYLGKKLYNLYVGFASAIVLGTFTTFFMFAKAAMTDVPLVCFILGSVYFLLLSDKPPNNDRYAALSGVFFGLALMTKQFVALLIPAIIIIYWFTAKRSIRFLFTKRFALFLAVGVLIFAPWAIAMYISFGSEFAHWYLTYTGVMRTFSPLEGHIGSPLYYFIFLATKENLLWIALLPLATGLCIFNSVAKHSKTDTLILLWMAIVFMAFTVAQTKIYYYIMPAYPAFAIAISALLYETAKKFNLKRYLLLKARSYGFL